VPLILSLTEGDHRDGAREGVIGAGVCVIKGDAHWMRIVVVLIYYEQRPLAVGTEHRIGGDEYMACGILYIAGGGEQPVLGIFWLYPLLGN
jgi:hypothetical protein